MRVLVAEDFAPFWQFIRSSLAERPDVQVIGEVADGLEGVQKAELLEPDLVLLDIGLPTLNGIEAARQIRQLQEALSSGALGYVVKTMAGGELLTAIKAVRGGRLFVGDGLSSPCSC